MLAAHAWRIRFLLGPLQRKGSVAPPAELARRSGRFPFQGTKGNEFRLRRPEAVGQLQKTVALSGHGFAWAIHLQGDSAA